MRLVDDRHGYPDFAPCLIYGKVFVAGDIPLIGLVNVLIAVVAITIDVQLDTVPPGPDLRSVELEQESIAIGELCRRCRGGQSVTIAVKFFSFSLNAVEDVQVFLHDVVKRADLCIP